MTAFPSQCPVSRSYKPGRYQTRRFESVSGAGTTRLYGNKAFDAQISLEYIADDETVQAFAESWHESMGGYLPISVPASVFGEYQYVFPAYLEWRWADEPSFSSIQPNLTRVSVNLLGTLEIQ